VTNEANSTWVRRGFARRVRVKIWAWTIRANRPLSIPEAICRQNPSVTPADVIELFHEWQQAAGSIDEGTADYGRAAKMRGVE
jgi:hypothetical protein